MQLYICDYPQCDYSASSKEDFAIIQVMIEGEVYIVHLCKKHFKELFKEIIPSARKILIETETE